MDKSRSIGWDAEERVQFLPQPSLASPFPFESFIHNPFSSPTPITLTHAKKHELYNPVDRLSTVLGCSSGVKKKKKKSQEQTKAMLA